MNSPNGFDKTSAFIDEARIKTLCIEIQGYVENIKKSLERVSDLVDDSQSFYQDDTRNVFVSKSNDFRMCHNIILNNMMSYIDDYNYVLSKYRSNDSMMTTSFSFEKFNK